MANEIDLARSILTWNRVWKRTRAIRHPSRAISSKTEDSLCWIQAQSVWKQDRNYRKSSFFFWNLLVITLDVSQHIKSCWGGVDSGNGLFRSNVLDVQLLNLHIPEFGILLQLLNFVFQLKDSVFHSWSVSVPSSLTCTSESTAVMSLKHSNCSRIFSFLSAVHIVLDQVTVGLVFSCCPWSE